MAKPTIHQVASRAGVSTTTVSRTINTPSLVDADTAEKVWAAIEELEYYPNGQARSLVSGRSRLLGLIVSDITNPFFPEVIKGFEDVAVEQGFDILIGSTDYDTQKMSGCVRRMVERRVDGVAIMTSEMDNHLIDQLARRKVPMVFLDVATPREGIANIVVNYERGINEAVDHLVTLGHRRIGFVSGPQQLKSAQIRRLAFLRSLSRYGIHEDDRLIVEGDHKVGGGLAAIGHLLRLDEKPTAVLASNDLTAIGMMRGIQAAGLTVPGGMSVVGFDDIWLAQFTDPPLTTVRLSRTELGQRAFHALVPDSASTTEGGQNSTDLTVDTNLIIRETTRVV
jgi:DNA-binding LacI/PurR family transcriptional regulator